MNSYMNLMTYDEDCDYTYYKHVEVWTDYSDDTSDGIVSELDKLGVQAKHFRLISSNRGQKELEFVSQDSTVFKIAVIAEKYGYAGHIWLDTNCVSLCLKYDQHLFDILDVRRKNQCELEAQAHKICCHGAKQTCFDACC